LTVDPYKERPDKAFDVSDIDKIRWQKKVVRRNESVKKRIAYKMSKL